jgi:hypothetical protein
MTTKNELHSTLNAVVSHIREAGAVRPGRDSEHWRVDWVHLGTGPGYAIAWQDVRNGGIDPIVRLGDNKRQAQETLWAITSVLAQLPKGE